MASDNQEIVKVVASLQQIKAVFKTILTAGTLMIAMVSIYRTVLKAFK